MTTNLKRIPFIPKLSREFKPMKHYLCETDTSVKLISRKAFMRQLAQQPCPKGQVFIDFDDGIVYLFPFDLERTAQFTVAYGEFETEYKCFYREQEAIRAGRRMTVVHLDQFDDSEADGNEIRLPAGAHRSGGMGAAERARAVEGENPKRTSAADRAELTRELLGRAAFEIQ